MKKTLSISIVVFALSLAGGAEAASYIKFDGVDGEVTSAPAPTGAMQITAQTATTSAAKGNVEYEWKVEEGEKAGPALLEIDTIRGESPEEAKGNVEMNWKVEEGEKSDPAQSEIDDIDEDSSDEESAESSRANDRLRNSGPTNDWPIAVSAVEVRGWDADQKQEFMATVKEHAQVRSEQDLENFARGILVEDESVEQIALNYEEIKFRYRSGGKLFGLIPLSFTEEVTLDTNATSSERVKVKFPWFAFLMSTDLSAEEIEADLEGEFGNGNEKWFRGTSGNFAELAEAFSTLSNILKTKHDTAKNSIGNVR